jgi:hypothetical protein
MLFPAYPRRVLVKSSENLGQYLAESKKRLSGAGSTIIGTAISATATRWGAAPWLELDCTFTP